MFICVIKHKTNVPENRIPDNGKILLYRLSRVIEKEKCPGGKRGVPGVPKDYYWLYTTIIDDLMVSLWCPYGVPQGHHSCGNANSWLIGTSHYSEISI